MCHGLNMKCLTDSCVKDLVPSWRHCFGRWQKPGRWGLIGYSKSQEVEIYNMSLAPSCLTSHVPAAIIFVPLCSLHQDDLPYHRSSAVGQQLWFMETYHLWKLYACVWFDCMCTLLSPPWFSHVLFSAYLTGVTTRKSQRGWWVVLFSLAFYLGTVDLNSGPHVCTARILTHWAISSAPK